MPLPGHHDEKSRHRWVLWGFFAIAGFFLITEHGAHFLGALPYLLLAACPVMHIFMHRGHHHGGPHRNTTRKQRQDAENSDRNGGEES